MPGFVPPDALPAAYDYAVKVGASQFRGRFKEAAKLAEGSTAQGGGGAGGGAKGEESEIVELSDSEEEEEENFGRKRSARGLEKAEEEQEN